VFLIRPVAQKVRRMSKPISAEKYYNALSLLAELANMSRSQEGQAHLESFTPEDCERFDIPGGWFLSRVNALPYALAVDGGLRQLAGINELPQIGVTSAISFNISFPRLEVTLQHDGTISEISDFFRNKFLAALMGRDIHRIRICPVCESIFIAFRKDASACRGRCTYANNTRNFRSRHVRQRYRENHKANVRRTREKRQWLKDVGPKL
jgi:hypothetical protein